MSIRTVEVSVESAAIAAALQRLADTQHIYAGVTARDMSYTPEQWAEWFEGEASALLRGETPGWLAGILP